MHANVFDVLFGGKLVILGAETSQPLFIQEGLHKRMTLHYKYVDSKVEFEVVDEVRIGYVFLDHIIVKSLQISPSVGKKDSPSLTALCRLADEHGFGFAVLEMEHLLMKLRPLGLEVPAPRQEVEQSREGLL